MVIPAVLGVLGRWFKSFVSAITSLSADSPLPPSRQDGIRLVLENLQGEREWTAPLAGRSIDEILLPHSEGACCKL